MIPLRDNVPTWHVPLTTWALVVANVLVFLFELRLSPDSLQTLSYLFGIVPARFSHPAWAVKIGLPIHEYWPFLTSMFLHAGWLHLIGNMIFLYICGCNIEDRWGRYVWALLYLAGGAAAALTWGALHKGSQVPLVGASGAIAAAMGAFLVVAARANLQFFYFFWLFTYPVKGTFFLRAYWAFPLWLLQQLFGMYIEGIAFTPVAYSAHVGGFAFGVLFALVMKWAGADRSLQKASEEKAVLFTEHPLYLEGLSHLKNNNLAAAESAFERLLAEKPDHIEASMELYRIKQDPAEAVRAASRAAVLARRSNDCQSPIAIYTDMQQRHPDAPLDERGLFAVAECYERRDNPRGAASVYERLVELHPRSPVAPRAMLNMAQLYNDRLGEPDRARQALIAVMQTHADSPFADRARELLSRLG